MAVSVREPALAETIGYTATGEMLKPWYGCPEPEPVGAGITRQEPARPNLPQGQFGESWPSAASSATDHISVDPFFAGAGDPIEVGAQSGMTHGKER